MLIPFGRTRQAAAGSIAQAKPLLEFLGEWGTKGVSPEQLQRPTSLATDAAGSVYLADAGSGFLHKFTFAGEPLLAFNDPTLPTPLCIAVDSDGAIYVSDASNHRVLVFSSRGEPIRQQRRGGGANFRSVAGMAVDGDGNLYVLDAGAKQVLKFDDRGRLRKAWGKASRRTEPGTFDSPTSIAIGADGMVYVIDRGKARVEVFTHEGQLVSAWGAGINDVAFQSPTAIAVNDRFAFVTDNPAAVHVLSLDGTKRYTEDLTARMGTGDSAGELRGIALAGKDELLVLDSLRAKVLRFRINF